jgi:hypothetical protein
MSNFSVGSDLRIASAVADPTLTSAPTASSSPEKSEAALYPQLSPGAVAGSLAQLKNTPIILFQPRGEEVMQQVGLKGPPAPGGYQPNSVSAACSDGKLANAGDAAGQAVGGALGPNGATFGGMLGREIGGILCEADDAFFTPIGSSEPEQAPAEEGGMSMMPAGPSMDGGFSSDPSVGGSSSAGSYIDPETGDRSPTKTGRPSRAIPMRTAEPT